MQTAKIIKTVIHRHVQFASKKKQVRHIHVQTDIPATRRFRHACNQKCLVEHTECFNATHSCKKQMVKNVVNMGLEVLNKVQENLSPSNSQDKVVSFIPECVSTLTCTLNKKKVTAVMGVQNPEPCTSTGAQTSRKSTSLIPKRKTTTPKASSVPKSQHTKKSSNPPPLPPPRRSFTNTFTTTVQVHSTSMTTRSATRSVAKTVDSALPSQASANMAIQNYVKQKMKSAKKDSGRIVC